MFGSSRHYKSIRRMMTETDWNTSNINKSEFKMILSICKQYRGTNSKSENL